MKVYKVIWGDDTYYSFIKEDVGIIQKHKIIQTEVNIDSVPLQSIFEAWDADYLGFDESLEWFYNHMKAVCGPEKAERILYNILKEKV